jgi:methionyl-tRNA formyltransferase
MKNIKRYILLTEKIWHEDLYKNLLAYFPNTSWYLINSKLDFTADKLKEIKPEKIFIPHWSYIIPEEIFLNYECIVFHMTDLPYGRGGSPLQNLIISGHKKTKISALKVDKGIDTGDIYLKKSLDLFGTAEEIFLRSVPVIFDMIKEIITENKIPQKQVGEIVEFKRRKPQDGNIQNLEQLNEVYDYIRMLDSEGYPNAFVELGGFRFEFSRVIKKNKNQLIADVRILKK